MAAVFPPPPPDPYAGLDGLERAWNRWRDWIMVDLPRQWDEFMGLLASLGNSPPPSGGGGTPPPSTIPPGGYYPIPAGWALSDLSEADRALAQAYIATWPVAFNIGTPVYAPATDFDKDSVTPAKAAIAALQWVALYHRYSVRLYPWNATPDPLNDWLWFPGLAFSWYGPRTS